MVWLIQFLILCAVFTLVIIPPLLKDPLSQITSYPPEVRATQRRRDKKYVTG